MEWRNFYLDAILVSMSVLLGASYNSYLWYRVKTHPLSTFIGINSIGRNLWLQSMIRENVKKNIILVQTLRNNIMNSTLMATTSILLCTGLAAFISSSYSIKKPINDTSLGGQGQLLVVIKYVTLLVFFVFSFFCHTLSVGYLNQVSYLANTITHFRRTGYVEDVSVINIEYAYELLEKGYFYNMAGNRLLYMGFPLIFWIFGPVFVLVSTVILIIVLYNLDFLTYPKEDERLTKTNAVKLQKFCPL